MTRLIYKLHHTLPYRGDRPGLPRHCTAHPSRQARQTDNKNKPDAAHIRVRPPRKAIEASRPATKPDSRGGGHKIMQDVKSLKHKEISV